MKKLPYSLLKKAINIEERTCQLLSSIGMLYVTKKHLAVLQLQEI